MSGRVLKLLVKVRLFHRRAVSRKPPENGNPLLRFQQSGDLPRLQGGRRIPEIICPVLIRQYAPARLFQQRIELRRGIRRGLEDGQVVNVFADNFGCLLLRRRSVPVSGDQDPLRRQKAGFSLKKFQFPLCRR